VGWRIAQSIRSRGRFESLMPGRVPPRPEVQPAEVPARMAAAGVPAGRTPARRVPTSRVASSASVLRHCGGEETDHAQQNRKALRRPHEGRNSSGHGLTTPGNVGSVYSSWGARECDFQRSAFSLRKRWVPVDRIPVERPTFRPPSNGTSNRLERHLRRQSKHDYLTWCLANSSGVNLPAFT
jgi:hypothetical protein